jgi:uncharacterized protein YcfJ
MKTLISAVVVGTFMTSAAMAQDVQIQDHYKTHVVKIPHQSYVCHDVEVPVYGKTGDASTFDTVGGAIIGGVIANQFGGGSGKDALTVLGAIAGADYANKNMKREGVVGYRIEERCKTHVEWETRKEERYSHSSATFWVDGQKVTSTFHRKVK